MELSRPSRGAWIETPMSVQHTYSLDGRALHGARGLKPAEYIAAVICLFSRALHGARGLKLDMLGIVYLIN